MTTLGVFGGSFDPPHVAHVLAASYALAVGNFERLLAVPVYRHAFDKKLASFEHRVAMCELAFAELPRVEVMTHPVKYKELVGKINQVLPAS